MNHELGDCQVGDLVSIDAHRVRALHHDRDVRARSALLPESRENQRAQRLRQPRLLELVHLKLGLSLKESRKAIQEGRVMVESMGAVTDMARIVGMECKLKLVNEAQQEKGKVSEIEIQHVEAEFMVVWKPADMTLKVSWASN